MAIGFNCVRCGCTREEHDLNLANEPAKGDLWWIETPREGSTLSILECMECDRPKEYELLIQKLELDFSDYWESAHGYQSRNPEEEERVRLDRPITYYGAHTFLLLSGGRGIIDLD